MPPSKRPPTRRLKNDPDQRMLALATHTRVSLPDKDLRALEPKNLDYYIDTLREGETAVRSLRKRLEALRDDSSRTCPYCEHPVTGRSDRIYCSDHCRIRAHRSRES